MNKEDEEPHSVWLKEGDEVVPAMFIKKHTNKACLDKQKVKEAIDKIKPCSCLYFESVNEIDICHGCRLKKELGL